jgi:Bacterial regulatory proteins, tetR family
MDLEPHSARDKLMISALKLIRTKGYGATTVDGLCKDAGVTKGAFFHHCRHPVLEHHDWCSVCQCGLSQVRRPA